MGAEQKKFSVATLNYSGIYLSPFEYYAIDNWQELERIGRIFQYNLKQQYNQIVSQNKKLGSQTKFSNEYDRKSFSWDVGKIDKVIHEDRYTPIYASSAAIQEMSFAGIGSSRQGSLVNEEYIMNKNQFLQKWKLTFDDCKDHKNQEIKSTARQASDLHKYNCFMFDFLCFKAIILYLNNRLLDDGNSLGYKISTFQEFDGIAKDSKPQLIASYKGFMNKYFEGINIQKKIDLTISSLFRNKRCSEIVTFTQATPEFTQRLRQISGYLLYRPHQSSKIKQTLILIKKTLPFIPNDYKVPEQSNEILQFTRYFNTQVPNLLGRFKSFWEQNWANMKKREQYEKALTKYVGDLMGSLACWMKDSIIAEFPDKSIVVGAFHLDSKSEKNCLQVQLLGLFIYYLIQIRKSKIIFSGDFNSYINTSEKGNQKGLFSFAQQLKLDGVDAVINAVSVYPKHPKIITTKKKRTILQVQIRKVNQLAEKSIDQIITNYQIDYQLSHVCEIKEIGSKKQSNEAFLPHKNHPYDHFLVEGFLDLNERQDDLSWP